MDMKYEAAFGGLQFIRFIRPFSQLMRIIVLLEMLSQLGNL